MEVWPTLLVLLAGLGVSAFCSAAETALTSLPASRVEQLRARGGPWTRWAWRRWRERPHRLLVTILVANNAVNILISALASELALRLGGQQELALAVGAVTLAVLVFGEITPKTLARVDPETLGRWAVVPVAAADVALLPLTSLLLGLSHLVAKLRGQALAVAPVAASLEDIRFLLSLSHQEGHLSELQLGMLEAVLSLERAKVKDVQVPRPDVVMLPDTASFQEVRAKVLASGYSRYPVFHERDDNIVGILHARDLLRCELEGKPWLAYLKPPLCVPETSRLVDVLREMRERRLHLAVVIDEYGAVAGVVSLEDVVETIVGDIADEFDLASPPVETLQEGVFLVKASLPLERVSRLLGVPLESPGKVSSLGGLLMALAGGVPQKGQRLEHQGVAFTVVDATPTRVLKVRLERLGPPPA